MSFDFDFDFSTIVKPEYRGHLPPAPPPTEFSWSPDQLTALEGVDRFLANGEIRAICLSGPAGTGKTTVLREALTRIHAANKRYHLTATTNKAANVAKGLTGASSGTIHSLLGLAPVPDGHGGEKLVRKNKTKFVSNSIVIVDEASMISRALLKAMGSILRGTGCRTIFVGDSYQLSPVGESTAPVFDLVKLENQFHLTTVHRQAADNPIIASATRWRRVLDGEPWPALEEVLKMKDDLGLERLSPNEFEKRMVHRTVEAFRAEDDDRTRGLSFTNARAQKINLAVRAELYGADAPRFVRNERLLVNSPVLRKGEILFGTDTPVRLISDPLVATVNDIHGYRLTLEGPDEVHTVFVADDFTQVKPVLQNLAEEGRQWEVKLKLAKKNNKSSAEMYNIDEERRAAWVRFYSFKESIADVRNPYALTVHKSQGSTYDEVFVDLNTFRYAREADMVARLLYVAITRARYKVYFCGKLPTRLLQ